METVLIREVIVPIKDSSRLEMAMRAHGFKNFIINYNDRKRATLIFDNDEDALVFILKGVLQQVKENADRAVSSAPEFEFMIRLEKKLKSYSKCDEFFIRKKTKDT